MSRNQFVFASILFALTALISTCPQSDAKSTRKSSTQKYAYGLVPPPPPMAVSPTVLASYPHDMTSAHSSFGMHRFHALASKPRPLRECMRLTCVMDDTAFFKVNEEESFTLKQGNTYQTIKLASLTPESATLEEKGKQFVVRLR